MIPNFGLRGGQVFQAGETIPHSLMREQHDHNSKQNPTQSKICYVLSKQASPQSNSSLRFQHRFFHPHRFFQVKMEEGDDPDGLCPTWVMRKWRIFVLAYWDPFLDHLPGPGRVSWMVREVT